MTDYIYDVTDVEASSGPTPWQTVGPFFGFALPFTHGSAIAAADRPGAFTLSGRVYDGAGDALPDALVEIWQADETGHFVAENGIMRHPEPGGFRGFGRCATDATGRFEFTTVKPAAVRTEEGTEQAPHLAMSVFARGMLRRVVTRVYFPDESAANADDPLLSALPAQRRSTLIATAGEDGLMFDVRLQGDDETVFLDVSSH